MAVTRTPASRRLRYFQEVDKILNSHSLRGSEALCKLLQYLAKQAIDHPGVAIREYQIATEVYGRGAAFDPHSDSTIRVQAGRLRTKLADYYAGEGTADPVVVRLPKGSYYLLFDERSPDSSLSVRPELEAAGQRTPAPPSLPWRVAVVVLSGCLAISLLLTIGKHLWTHKLAPPATAVASIPADSPLRVFWHPFLSRPEVPWVIFSNAAFIGRPETGMRYYNPQQDSQTTVRDQYTGVGEVLAVDELDQAFASMGRRLRIKRGSLFSLDDAKNTDLIFVGSPSENLSLLDIPGTQEFVFRRVTSGPRQGDLAIVTTHPHSGEAEKHLASPSDAPLTDDYGVVSLLPGLTPIRSVMILAGTTTFGTQGAVDFICRPDSVEHLLRQIPSASSGQIKPFEALVHVKIARGVPLETDLVAVRAR